jgi:hypothetical protein
LTRRLSTMVAAAVVVGIGLVACSEPDGGPSGTPSSTAGPAPTTIDPGLMLQLADLPGTGWTPGSAEPIENADKWYWAEACAGYRSADYPSLRQQLDVEVVSFTSGSRRITEVVALYRPGFGAQNLADVRRLLTTCTGTRPSPGSRQVPPPAIYTIIGTGLAGDESMLVRVEQYAYAGETIGPTPVVWLVAEVRVGDRVATLLPPTDATADSVRPLAQAAAARLAR